MPSPLPLPRRPPVPIIACPHCAVRVRIPDGFASAEVRCPQCQGRFSLNRDAQKQEWSSAPPPVRRPAPAEDRPRTPSVELSGSDGFAGLADDPAPAPRGIEQDAAEFLACRLEGLAGLCLAVLGLAAAVAAGLMLVLPVGYFAALPVGGVGVVFGAAGWAVAAGGRRTVALPILSTGLAILITVISAGLVLHTYAQIGKAMRQMDDAIKKVHP